jgi:copper(I)-binding protein
VSRSPKTCVAFASRTACACAVLLAACDMRADEPPPVAQPTIAAAPMARLLVKDAWARAADSGAMTAIYFTITNESDVSDTLSGVRSTAAEETGLHMSMQMDRTMHMAALQSLPVPAQDSVLFAPLGAHVMLTRTTRRYAAGDTLPLTLTFASGQTVEVRAGVRFP